jgi:hypothetical protein
MNDLDNLIIAAFRDKNFKFAAEAPDVDPEASALAILNGRLDNVLLNGFSTNTALQQEEDLGLYYI